jgi:hypothetical protein
LKTLSPLEEQTLLNFLLPIPKHIEVRGMVRIPLKMLVLHLPKNKTLISEQVAEEFCELFSKAGVPLTVKWSLTWNHTAILALDNIKIDEGWSYEESEICQHNLEQVPTKEQAYGIITREGERWEGAAMYAFSDTGLYYAAKTLKQLIAPHISGKGEETSVIIPKVFIVDYPDLPERGLWGNYAINDIPWLAERKLNLLEIHCSLTVDENGNGHAFLDPKIIILAKRHAIKLVPIIRHLDQLETTGIFKQYPNIVAKGDPAKWPKWNGIKPICFAREEAQKVLADWMIDLAKIEGVDAVTVWLSESPVQCECDICRKNNQFVMETRACLHAWQKARKIKPQFELRILLTQGSYPHNELVLREVPANVHVIYYHGGLTYSSSHKPMIYPLLEDFVKQGNWLGVCPQLTSSWRIVSPFSGAHFIHERVREFITKGLKCLYGYATPSVRCWEFNLNASAEWSWNLNGRTTREFAAAWATREGFEKPDLVAEWSETIGPASWDVYACGVPYPWFFGGIGRLLRERKVIKPGEGPLAEIPTDEHLQNDIARAERALKIAEQINDERLIAESTIILGYLKILSTLPEISSAVARIDKGGELTSGEKERVATLIKQVKESTQLIKQSLWDWIKKCDPSFATHPPQRFIDTVNFIERNANEITEAVKVMLL